MFRSRDRHDWTDGQFAALLGQTIFTYLASALIYPDFWAHETFDLRTYYFSQSQWFFGSLCLVVIFSLLRNLALTGSFAHGADFGFHTFFLAATTGLFNQHEFFHQLMATLVTAIFVLYVVTLFARLH